MPLGGGELVGRAYVRIYGDGSSMPGDIRKAIEESEPSVREGGRDSGHQFAEEMDDEFRKTFKTKFGKTKEEMFHDLNEDLTKSVADLRLAERYFDGPEWKKFLRRLDDEFGAAGRLAGRNLEREFRDSADLDQLAVRMRHVGVDVRRAQESLVSDLYNDAYRMNREFDQRIAVIAQKAKTLQKQAEQDSLRGATLFRERFKEIIENVDRLERGEPGVHRSRLIEMLGDLRRLAPSIATSDRELLNWVHHIDDQNRRLREATPLFSKFLRGIEDIGNGMGRAFGKGSRNNFLNFFGSVVEGMVGLLGIFPKAGQAISKFSNGIREAFVEAGGGAEGTIAGANKALTSMGGLLLTVGTSVIAFAGFLAILGLVLGPVVALLSSFVGLLLAMASSAIFAVIGALAGFGPLLFAAGGAVAGVIAVVQAIKNASEAAPRLKSALHDISGEASKLWHTFQDEALKNLPDVLDRVRHAMEPLGGLASAAGKGFNRLMSNIADAADSPAIQAFFDRFQRFLPHAEAQLGNIVGNAFKGLAGILRASVPLANKLLDYLDGVFEDFAKWANSKQGQKEIRQFLKGAADSAESLGDFLAGAWDWLTQLIGKSKSEGDTLWERLGGKFQKWADYIRTHPDAFENWMKDADELATHIGKVVDGLNHLIDTLDSPRNRDLGNDFLDGLAFALDNVGTLLAGDPFIGIFEQFRGPITTAGKEFGKAVWYVVGGAWVGDLIHGITDAAKGIGNAVSGIASTLGDSLKGLFKGGSLGGGALSITPHLDTGAIANALAKLPGLAMRGVEAMISPFRGLAGRIASAAGNIAQRVGSLLSSLPGRAADIANQMVGRFGNLAERIARNIGDLWRSISSKFTSIPASVGGVVDNIVAEFTGLGGRIIAAIGSINIHINWPDPPGWLSKVTASGGIFSGAQARIIGEAGPEAVVPLNRPLSMVDPAVRGLSAIAQGLALPGMGGDRTLVSADGWTIVSPSEDPRIVATEVLNELVARIA